MSTTALEVLKTMLEAGLARIKEIEGEETAALSVEAETKPKKAAVATTTRKRKASAEPEVAPAEEAKSEEPKAEEPKTEVTLEQIRAVLQEKRAEGKKDKFKALFESFGVQRLPDVSPDQYAALLSAAEAL